MKKKYSQLAIALIVFFPAFSQPGSLDQSFGNGGKVTFNFENTNSNYESGKKCFPLLDGKILVAYQNGKTLEIVRLFSDGNMDNTFGIDGFAEKLNMNATNCLLQPDGKLVLIGTKISGNSFFTLGRLTSSGLIDNTFGQNGLVIFNFYSFLESNVLIQPDGKILIGVDSKLIRLNMDGSYDNSFGNNGIAAIDFSTYGIYPNFIAVHLTNQGKILVRGSNYSSGSYKTILLRYLPNGALDVTYDGDGIVIVNYNLINNIEPNISCSALQQDGKLLVAGTFLSYNPNYNADGFIARFQEDGSLDPSFNTTGTMIVNFGASYEYDNIAFITVQSDNKILIVANRTTIVRYNTDGSTDISFGTNGKIIPLINGNNMNVYYMNPVNSGEIFVTGVNYSIPQDCIVMKFDNNGTVDNTFSNDGIVSLFKLGSPSEAKDVFKLSDGSILCIGNNNPDNYGVSKLSFAKFLPNGSPDNSFGTNGKVITNFSGLIEKALMQQDEKLLVPVSTGIARFTNSGEPDITFSGTGLITYPLISNYNYYGGNKSMAIQADGKILVLVLVVPKSGPANYYQNYSLALLRFYPDGNIDNTFGTNGVQLMPAGYLSSNDARGFSDADVMVRSDGKIVVTGLLMLQSRDPNYGYYIYLARFNSDGIFDNTFDGDGVLLTNLTYSYSNYNLSSSVLNDNKILVNYFSQIYRFNENGSPDNTFGNAGKVDTYPNVSAVYGNIAIQPDGKIIKSGMNWDFGVPYPYLLSRINANGSVDITFGNNGKVQINPKNTFFTNDIRISGDFLFLCGYTDWTIKTGLIHKYKLFDIQIFCPPDVTATTPLGNCYVAVNNIDPVLSTGNSFTTVNYTLSGATTGAGTGSVSGMQFNTGVTTVTYTLAADPSQTCSFTVTVDSYTLLGIQSIKLQQNNTVVNGSVGVVSSTGSASIKKNFIMNDAGAFLKAQYISLQAPYTIPTIIYAPAVVTLPSMQYNITSTSGLSNATIPNNTTIEYGNLRNVIIGTNCNVTLKGTVYGNITIGSGSKVTFTQSSIDVTAITMNAGTVSTNTQLKFSSDAKVRVAGSILVNTQCDVNPDNHKVVMYLGKINNAPVAFTVAAGGYVTVNASMFIPSGKISVGGGGDGTHTTNMNGKFIAENIETLDKYVIWDWYDCAAAYAPLIASKSGVTVTEQKTEPVTGLYVKAWPNPSDNQFTIKVASNRNETVELKVYDMTGRVVYTASGTANRQYQFGNRFVSGTYIVEVKQGAERETVKLIKQ